jgi:hypothetical protein
VKLPSLCLSNAAINDNELVHLDLPSCNGFLAGFLLEYSHS